MRNNFNFPNKLLATAICASLAACGGGADSGNSASPTTTLATISSTATSGTTTVWTQCATEGGTCNFTGTADVRYGTATSYVTKTVTGPVACSNNVFGDSAPNYVKACSVASTVAATTTTTATAASAAPASWTQCATEGGTCNFSGTQLVRYGTATAAVTKTETGPVACSNNVFGDPAPNNVKACSIGGTVIDTTAGAASSTTSSTASTTSTTTSSTSSTSTSSTASTPTLAISGTGVTAVQLVNTTSAAETNAPVTFGQVFAQGDVPSGTTLVGKTASGVAVPLQVDVKARHPDGSVRHAVITAQMPSIAANGAENVSLIKSAAAATTAQTTPAALLSSGFTASFTATIGGVKYTASADALLKSGKYITWLSGPLVNEWIVSAPLTTAAGVQHPHLMAQFAIRAYAGNKNARVDVTVENDWAYEPSPQNFTYDASIVVGGNTVYSKAGMTQLHHSRWRKIFWYGSDPQIAVRQDVPYLLSTRAIPNYDQSISISSANIANVQSRWANANKDPMGTGITVAYMPTTGGRDDIGLMQGWAVSYLLSQNINLKEITLRNADLAGSFSSHYRDKNTGRPVSLTNYPYMTIEGNPGDTLDPATGKYESFPVCGGDCSTPNTADVAHQPALAYLPYLVTGDYYYLEELQFWAMYNSFESNPGYRGNIKGLVFPQQVRGQAWSMRTLGEVAYITPDNDSMKSIFNTLLDNNLDYYNTNYTNNTSANKLGVIVDTAMVYDNGIGLAPWQDDFFTSAIGHVAELGFSKANALLAWKANFPVSRMVGAGACWIDGSIYDMTVRSSSTGPLFNTIGEAYAASHTSAFDALACGSSAMASSLSLQVGEMTGYSDATDGFPSNMQPALAYAANAVSAGKSAWNQFMARTVKPAYGDSPQFDIVPR
ncbi:MAG TPA: hypothetical protein VF793_17600 [Telluria sp.]